MDGRPPSSPAEFRLKRSIDPLSASDGSIYLLRTGGEGDFRIAEPTPSDRMVLSMLGDGFVTAAELRAALRGRGMEDESVPVSLSELERAGLIERADPGARLGEREAERYDRQLIYFSDLSGPGLAAEAMQMRLRRAHVVVLGCGGLGSWAACGLACAGVGRLTLIDDDTVELSNLNRQLLFGERDLGRPKVAVARRELARHDSSLRLETHRERVADAGRIADLVRGADLLVSTADWPPHELPRRVNRACLAEGVPYITAGQFPPLIRVGPMVLPGSSACLECLESQTRRDFPLYDEVADFRASRPSPASTVGATSGMIGSMIAMEAIHLLTGAVRPASVDRALILDVKTMAMTHEEVRRDGSCPACAQPARERGSTLA